MTFFHSIFIVQLQWNVAALGERKPNAKWKFRKLPVRTVHTRRRQRFRFAVSPLGEVTSQHKEQIPVRGLQPTLVSRSLHVCTRPAAFHRSPGRMLLSEHCGGHKVRGSPVTPVLPRTSRTARRPLHYCTQSHVVDLEDLQRVLQGSSSQLVESRDPQWLPREPTSCLSDQYMIQLNNPSHPLFSKKTAQGTVSQSKTPLIHQLSIASPKQTLSAHLRIAPSELLTECLGLVMRSLLQWKSVCTTALYCLFSAQVRSRGPGFSFLFSLFLRFTSFLCCVCEVLAFKHVWLHDFHPCQNHWEGSGGIVASFG